MKGKIKRRMSDWRLEGQVGRSPEANEAGGPHEVEGEDYVSPLGQGAALGPRHRDVKLVAEHTLGRPAGGGSIRG